MQKFALPAAWTARAVSNFDEVPPELAHRDIPAEVPGCIHLDLLRENLIVDPYLDRNELAVQWIGRTDWEFRTTFEVTEVALAEERLELVCEGLDTVATVIVNGIEVGRTENMHVEYRFDVKAAVHAGQNEITITFASAALYARAMRDRLGALPNTYPDHEPYNFIRKNACNFGWDWGPTLITCGIWKPIRLLAWSTARLKNIRPLVMVANEDFAIVDVVGEIEWSSPREILDQTKLEKDDPRKFPAFQIAGGLYLPGTESIKAQAGIHSGISEFKLSFTVEKPALWWPAGYGEHPLYDLDVLFMDYERFELEDNEERARRDSSLLFKYQAQIGLRTVELDTSPDTTGSVWDLKVNDQKIWCKGANWIPDDVFLTRACDPERLQTRIQQAADAGMNMLRIWGGGIYESDAFYSICDQMGIIVWQDFLFACAAYAEEEPMRGLVEAEVRHNVARLVKHPSLVLWNGCNENIWGYFDWGWKKSTAGRTWGAGYYFDLLPRWVAEMDPSRPYWPGSPYSGTMDIHPLADQWGPKHIWDTWNEVDHNQFRRYSPRFASEFGHQAPPSYSALARSIPEDQRDPYSPAMLHHQKANDGNKKLMSRLGEQFDIPENFDDWHYLTHVVQARAMQTAVEWFRTRATCSGALYWQLNDCWPVTSWAAIDGDGIERPLYWASQRFFADRLLCIQPDGDAYAVWAHNDSAETWHAEVAIGLLHFDGTPLRQETFYLSAAPRELIKVARLGSDWKPADKTQNLLTASSAGVERAFWFYLPDKELVYPAAATGTYDAVLNQTGPESYELAIKTHVLLRDLTLNADRLGAKVTGGWATLLPGESFTFKLQSARPLTTAQLAAPPILQDATRFGKR